MPAHASPRVVVLGGGFGGLEAAFNLRMRLGKKVDVTVVSDRDTFLFRPNTIYIPFGDDPERFVLPVTRAFARRGMQFVLGRATGIDPRSRRVITSAGDLAYDYLVVATGSAMHAEELPGLAKHAHTIWTPPEMLRLRGALQRAIEAGRGERPQRVLFLIPVDNKCSGPLYEIVLMLDTWLRRRHLRQALELTYATSESGYIQAFGPRMDPEVTGEFRRRGITGLKEKRARAVEASQVRFDDGTALPYDVLVSFPPHVASARFAGLPTDERGFLRTETEARQVEGFPDIYAVGDAGDFPIKQAFLALLQADAAAEHIAQRVVGKPAVARFDPVSMCILEQFDKATFAQVPLRLTGDPLRPAEVPAERADLYRLGSGKIWRLGKSVLGYAMPARFRRGRPFHAGVSWTAMDAVLKVMSVLFASSGGVEEPVERRGAAERPVPPSLRAPEWPRRALPEGGPQSRRRSALLGRGVR